MIRALSLGKHYCVYPFFLKFKTITNFTVVEENKILSFSFNISSYVLNNFFGRVQLYYLNIKKSLPCKEDKDTPRKSKKFEEAY